MMDPDVYEGMRKASSELFKNSLVVPVGATANEKDDGMIAISEIREDLGGRVESNQIREVLNRLTAIGALSHLPSPRRSEPHLWRREDHPFWTFVEAWCPTIAGEASSAPW